MGPSNIAPQLDLYYGVGSQRADEETRRKAALRAGLTTGAGAANAATGQGATTAADPFQGMKAGETREFRGFNANQVGVPGGGMTIISGPKQSSESVFNGLRTRGYTADEAIKAAGIFAEADLTNTRAGLLPGTTAAANALTAAQTGLTGAQTGLTNVQAAELPLMNAAQRSLLGTQEIVNRASAGELGSRARNLDSDTSSNNLGISFMSQLDPETYYETLRAKAGLKPRAPTTVPSDQGFNSRPRGRGMY